MHASRDGLVAHIQRPHVTRRRLGVHVQLGDDRGAEALVIRREVDGVGALVEQDAATLEVVDILAHEGRAELVEVGGRRLVQRRGRREHAPRHRARRQHDGGAAHPHSPLSRSRQRSQLQVESRRRLDGAPGVREGQDEAPILRRHAGSPGPPAGRGRCWKHNPPAVGAAARSGVSGTGSRASNG